MGKDWAPNSKCALNNPFFFSQASKPSSQPSKSLVYFLSGAVRLCVSQGGLSMHLMAVDGPRLVSLPSFRLEQDSDHCRNFEVFFDNRQRYIRPACEEISCSGVTVV